MSSFATQKQQSGKAAFWSIERVVALLTPVFGILSGAATVGVGSAVGVPKTDYAALAITGIVAAVSAALKWLHGRSQFTAAEQFAKKALDEAHALGGPSLSEIEGVLQSHYSSVIDAIGSKIGAPVAAEDIAKQVVQRLISGQVASASAAPAAPASGGVATGS